ncbi:hypothetical protein SPAN111604_14350 [Sphingomonas antarctica]|uniref:hypothetical protein n=1 Tax=Sphingomonas antarctica TaxID=2040274 RepID=UPI0039E90190
MPSSNHYFRNCCADTLFARMRRGTLMPQVDQDLDTPIFLSDRAVGAGELAIADPFPVASDGAVRFVRGESDGGPAVVMEERGQDDVWHDSWALPTDSVDAREGMIGWLNTQSHRWDRFANMLRRRGADELTKWIFELMVVPNSIHATPARFESQRWTYLHRQPRAAGRTDDCSCRPGSVQHSRDL